MFNHIEKILVSDFDGTMTQHDFYRLIVEHLLPPDVPDYWAQYRAGTMTHFDALRNYFAETAPGENVLIDLAHRMGLEPRLNEEISALRASGWEIVIASAGCSWYIDLLLAEVGAMMDVHANPGKIQGGRLLMELPVDSPFCSIQTGIDKAAVVRDALHRSKTVAFAGDGLPDLEPALLVPEQYRFARGALADALKDAGENFRPFDRWAEVAQTLCVEA